MTNLDLTDFRRILLIKPSSPGDIIHALPVLHGLHRRYPAAYLAWLVAAPFVNLIEADPAINEVIAFDRRRFGQVGRSLRITREFVAFLRELRRRRFDLVIDLQGLLRSGFLARATRAPVRIGFAAAREMAWIFYTHPLDLPDHDAHAAEKNYAVAKLLGFADLPMDFTIALTPEDRDSARRLLKEAGFESREPYVVLVPTTRWETKCWPPDRFGKLARLLRERHGLRSALVGGPADSGIGDLAACTAHEAASNLCGQTTLRELAALVERAAIVVTADSTPMHMAAALGRPLVALFGPTNPRRTGPCDRLMDVLRIELPCSPCYLRKLRQCPHEHACMQRLTVDDVAEAVALRLESTSEE